MRTVKVDTDHVANFERVAKGVYHYTVVHSATNRTICSGDSRAPTGDHDVVVTAIALAARQRLQSVASKRQRDSRAFADGKPVTGAPARGQLPPAERAAVEAGQLDISAAIPQKLIRDAYRVSPIAGETPDSHRSRCNHAALAIGHQVLIGVTDEIILRIARGEASITGSLRTGVRLEASA